LREEDRKMNPRISATVAAFVFAFLGAQALCDETPKPPADSPPTVESREQSGSTSDEQDRREKIRLEYEARREAQRREWYERHRSLYGDRYDYDAVDVVGAVIGIAADEAPVRQRFAVGVVYAPANAGKMSGVGIQFINRDRRWGASVWLSGALERAGDVIDVGIPHNDYHLQTQQGSYGVEALYSVGSDNASLVVGAGLAVEQTMYTAVSNVTGWRWNHGSDSRVKFAAQVGCSVRLARRVSLSLGYDTHQSAFFGLTGEF